MRGPCNIWAVDFWLCYVVKNTLLSETLRKESEVRNLQWLQWHVGEGIRYTRGQTIEVKHEVSNFYSHSSDHFLPTR